MTSFLLKFGDRKHIKHELPSGTEALTVLKHQPYQYIDCANISTHQNINHTGLVWPKGPTRFEGTEHSINRSAKKMHNRGTQSDHSAWFATFPLLLKIKYRSHNCDSPVVFFTIH